MLWHQEIHIDAKNPVQMKQWGTLPYGWLY